MAVKTANRIDIEETVIQRKTRNTGHKPFRVRTMVDNGFNLARRG